MTDNTPVTRGDLLKVAKEYRGNRTLEDAINVTFAVPFVLDTAEQPTPPEPAGFAQEHDIPAMAAEDVADLIDAFGVRASKYDGGWQAYIGAYLDNSVEWPSSNCAVRRFGPLGEDACKKWCADMNKVFSHEEPPHGLKLLRELSAPPATETRARGKPHDFEEAQTRDGRCGICWHYESDSIHLHTLPHCSDCGARADIPHEPDCPLIVPSPSTDSGIVERLRDTAGRSHEIGDVLSVSLCKEAASRIETLEKERDELNLAYHKSYELGGGWRDRAEKAEEIAGDLGKELEAMAFRAEKAKAEAKRLREALEKVAIKRVGRMASGGRSVPTGYACDLCGGTTPENDDLSNLPEGGFRRHQIVHRKSCALALQEQPKRPIADELIDETIIDYVLRYGGSCHDCADEDGTCPGSGIACDRVVARKAVTHVLSALRYGVRLNYISLPLTSQEPSHG